MNKEKIFKTLSKYKKDLEDRGYNVIYIGLYGSQNYSVDDEQSDIDARAIILPSLHDIVFRKVTSKVIEYDEGDSGMILLPQCRVMDSYMLEVYHRTCPYYEVKKDE